MSGVLVVLALVGCDDAPEPPEPPRAEEPRYSRWVVDVRGAELPFDEITFKDAGLSLIELARRDAVDEAIARALADALGSDALSASVRRSEAAGRPESHLFCAPRHVYVDLWHGRSPERWGYSLWSGCADEQRFAWRELEREAGSSERAMIERLAGGVAGDLREALRTRCFTRSCGERPPVP